MRLSSFAPLLILCLIVSVAACKSSATSETRPSTGPAGKVMEVVGEVKARRGSEAQRDLEVGHIVYAEDLVHTGPKASVAIYLTHNGAVHNIGAEQEITIKGSLAWTAVSKSSGAFDESVEGDGTGAAGSHSEGSAANVVAQEQEIGEGGLGMSGSGSDSGGTDKSKGQRPDVVSTPNDKPAPAPAPERAKPLDANREIKTGGKLLTRTDGQDEIAANYQWPAGRGTSPVPGASPPINQPDTEENMAAAPVQIEKPAENTEITEERSMGDAKVGESVEEVGKKEGKDQNVEDSTKAGKAASKQLTSPQSVVLKLAKTCQKEHKGSGSFELILRFSNFKIVELRTKGPTELTETLSCLREKLRAVGSKPEKESWSFSLKL